MCGLMEISQKLDVASKLFAMLLSVLLAILNILKSKANKQITFDSLIFELEVNKAWVKDFISFCKKGNHLGDKTKGVVTLNLSMPKLNNHEKYSIQACEKNSKLLNEINDLYAKLDACKILADSALVIFNTASKSDERDAEIIKRNTEINVLCLSIENSFDNPIKQLNRLRR